MIPPAKTAVSTIGKKIFMGLSGLLLCGFIVGHLAGNLALLNPDPEPFNRYAHFLRGLGTALYAAEIILAAVFLVHFLYAVWITWENRKARGTRYEVVTGAGSPSRKTFASTTMIYTGAAIITFLVIHIRQFKFAELASYTAADGIVLRDFYSFLHHFFSDPLHVALYIAVMVLLGLHLSHGFWSAFQSLGVSHPVYTPIIYGFGYIFAAALAGGFVLIPLWIFFAGGSP